jgi:hypothetical protein
VDKYYLVEKEMIEEIKLIPGEEQIESTDDENFSIVGKVNEEDVEVDDQIEMKSEVADDNNENDDYFGNLCIPLPEETRVLFRGL